uniref:Eukaryotic translation initiation factor 2A n=1 Tax=Neogobius melanostomus TaxID=47308 RepID=A0A8C6SEB9_9GOBI
RVLTVLLEFSPQNNILATWQPYASMNFTITGEANLQLWEAQSGVLLKALFQKKVECPSWSEDESLAVRSVNNELHFYENNDFSQTILHFIRLFRLRPVPGAQPSKIAVYVPGTKGAPSFVRLYQYPSFFKSDKVFMHWNRKATAVLVTASTEVDKSGASYYGEQTLHFLGVNGETALVQLPKGGPIYDVSWSPSSSEFCVVYGFMPAKATVYNLHCDAVFDFGDRPAQLHRAILVLAGSGNCVDSMEVWDVKEIQTAHFAWAPDGEHVVTATCSPRLRVQVTVRHEVRWQDAPFGRYPERPITYQTTPTALGSTQHEEEPAQNMKPGSNDKNLSKTALKNQRKREAKKAAKQVRENCQNIT